MPVGNDDGFRSELYPFGLLSSFVIVYPHFLLAPPNGPPYTSIVCRHNVPDIALPPPFSPTRTFSGKKDPLTNVLFEDMHAVLR